MLCKLMLNFAIISPFVHSENYIANYMASKEKEGVVENWTKWRIYLGTYSTVYLGMMQYSKLGYDAAQYSWVRCGTVYLSEM